MIETPDAHAADSSPARVLVVQADPDEAARTRAVLEGCASIRFETEHVGCFEEAALRLKDQAFDAVLLDVCLPDTGGEETLLRARVLAWSVPLVVIIEANQEELAFKSLRLGAQDFVVKQSWDALSLVRTLRSAMERHRLVAELTASRRREYLRATHDGLTGLPNRAYFQDQLGRLLAYASRHGKSLALLFIDLNRFKNINDSMGHQVGDEILKIAGERLSATVRRSDLAARLGGDEFVAVAQDVSRERDPATVARKILTALAEPCTVQGRRYWITGSVGIAVFPRDGNDGETLIRNADAAMYHAKAQGPSQYRFYAEHLNASVAEALDLENGLHGVLEREELVVHYEPKIEPVSGQLVAAEAIVSWRHPTRGLLEADEFMAVAQESGAIVEMGEWVLRKACEDATRWNRDRSAPIRVAVNVVSTQLRKKGFAEMVSRLLKETGSDPRWLEIEVSEDSIVESPGTVRATLKLLLNLGVSPLVDHFRTGLSSLLEFGRVPVVGVKLHRSLVAGIGSGPANDVVTKALIDVGKGFGLAVSAEGVESTQQLEFLRAQGCRAVQGPLLGRPLHADEVGSQAPVVPEVSGGDGPQGG